MSGVSIASGVVATDGSGTGGSALNVVVVTADATATSGSLVVANVTLGSIVVSLPASPSNNDQVTVTLLDETTTGNTVSVSGNGKQICAATGTGARASTRSGYSTYQLVFSSGLNAWLFPLAE